MLFVKKKLYNVAGSGIHNNEIYQNIDSINQQLSNDLIIVSQPNLMLPADLSTQFQSKAITYADFVHNLSNDIVAALDLGSMAFEQSEKYATNNHVHPEYCRVKVESYFNKKENGPLSSIVTIEDNGNSTNIAMPLTYTIKSVDTSKISFEPKIGDIKCFGLQNFSLIAKANNLNLDINSDSFSGWIYPNGQSIANERFPEAYAIFGGKLPIFNDFIKLSPQHNNVSNTRNIIKGQYGMNSHCHSAIVKNIKLKLNNASISFKTQWNGVGHDWIKDELANGKLVEDDVNHVRWKDSNELVTMKSIAEYKNQQDKIIYAKPDIDASTGCIQTRYSFLCLPTSCECSQQNIIKIVAVFNVIVKNDYDLQTREPSILNKEDTYPSYVTIPVLMYIGKPKL